MLELDLFGNVYTYPVMCVACDETHFIEEEPLTKQLSFFICKKCENDGVEQLEFDFATIT